MSPVQTSDMFTNTDVMAIILLTRKGLHIMPLVSAPIFFGVQTIRPFGLVSC